MNEACENYDPATVEALLSATADSTDESLIAAIRAGDEVAFEQLFNRHRRKVARLVGRFFNRPERVEELLQDIFAKIYFALGDYSKERGAGFPAWLARVAVNACYDELRRARRRPESALGDMTGDETAWLNTRLRAG